MVSVVRALEIVTWAQLAAAPTMSPHLPAEAPNSVPLPCARPSLLGHPAPLFYTPLPAPWRQHSCPFMNGLPSEPAFPTFTRPRGGLLPTRASCWCVSEPPLTRGAHGPAPRASRPLPPPGPPTFPRRLRPRSLAAAPAPSHVNLGPSMGHGSSDSASHFLNILFDFKSLLKVLHRSPH